MSKNEYVYTTGELGTPTKVYNYSYDNSWKDQLTSFDGSSITYDAIGNPTSYLGAALTWSKGRLLTRYVNGDKTVTMQYDANGIRRFKQAPALIEGYKYTLYVYDNEGRLRAETTNVSGTNFRYYLYSSDGIIGYEENGERFLYRKNLFGDITAIYKGTTKVAEYQYDAWGNCTITLNTRNYGTNNPFRYRGYYYDNDLEMYYLMSRYYDPKTGRFINTDTFDYLKPKAVNGLNLYAYCKNNPVMYKDPSGHETWSEDFVSDLLSGVALLILAILSGVTIDELLKSQSLSNEIDLNSNFYPHGPDCDVISPDTVNHDGTNGYGLIGFLFKGTLYIDEEKQRSFYFSLGNIEMYAGISIMKGIGIRASESVLELGYDGRIVDISAQALSAGISLIYTNGKVEAECGWGWYGFSISIDFGELVEILTDAINAQ